MWEEVAGWKDSLVVDAQECSMLPSSSLSGPCTSNMDADGEGNRATVGDSSVCIRETSSRCGVGGGETTTSVDSIVIVCCGG